MEDSRIVELFWERSERAISETDRKYGKYCYSIARNILGDREDAQEAVNDAYLGAWESIPPHRPAVLATFLGKITRRLSINRWRDQSREKRGGGQVPLVLGELEECIASGLEVERQAENARLGQLINAFVDALPPLEQKVFVCRYWYFDPISQIARRFGFSQSKVKSMLYRTRGKLKAHLKKEGVFE